MLQQEEGNPEEDALIALGKMVKGGAKFLRRKMSKGQMRHVQEAQAQEGQDGAQTRPRLRRSASAPSPRTTQEPADDEEQLHVEFMEPRHCF